VCSLSVEPPLLTTGESLSPFSASIPLSFFLCPLDLFGLHFPIFKRFLFFLPKVLHPIGIGRGFLFLDVQVFLFYRSRNLLELILPSCFPVHLDYDSVPRHFCPWFPFLFLIPFEPAGAILSFCALSVAVKSLMCKRSFPLSVPHFL